MNIVIVGLDYNMVRSIANELAKVMQYKFIDLTKRFDRELIENINYPIGLSDDELIEKDELSIDHVIPWSYLYSDDIWNLVYVHKVCNSSKSNRIPSKSDIKELKERNLRLQEIVHQKRLTGKIIDELDVAIV